ncbi:MAG: exodeoxyribonuclease VII small subunit [Clostridia bacterium]|nr:exodeoxyribonuclease VII small subunit [Clostridia bacterium]
MKEMTFEEKIARLEQIVETLESGKCPLEEATALFDEGIKLSADCDKVLQSAMQKITDISAAKEN